MADREVMVIVDAGKLADLDEARDSGAASSYRFLNAELGRLRNAASAGSRVVVEDEASRYSLRSGAEVVAWARGRYPHANPAESSAGGPDSGASGSRSEKMAQG
ncbi:MAG TPA: hypothetical protein VFT74_00440 [Isosphaeraceae bacterium]|nr:hypothetical protein [Isosphaeraceae bacterium]